jgi:2,4-dienoyl-CoA reductase-like NADH-dependent reductase (Old Yellow Enzyme family)/thioredoxin reductase
MTVEFRKLFEPGRIGRLELKNRILFGPMLTQRVSEDGEITDRQIDYYVERAKGGAGAIIIESCRVHFPEPKHRVLLTHDRFIPALKRLVDAIHKEGAKVICQMQMHGGRLEVQDPASASAVPNPYTGAIPRVVTIAEIKEMVGWFADGARRAKEAGFDAISIHAANGYLLCDFLSPLINKRTDEYGGDLKGRARFALELIECTRQKVGLDYPILFRLMADDRLEGGFRLKEAIELCKMLEKAGIDAVDITAGGADSREWTAPPYYFGKACNTDLAGPIKKEIKIPVSVAGRINDPYTAEQILKDGKADFVCIARGILADPHFPRKAMAGRARDIRPCIACMRCVICVAQGIPVVCTVNPAAGKEREFELRLKRKGKRKKVLVVGGGPGGMEAAIVAAQKGHHVTLWEATDKVGGQLNVAIRVPGKGDFQSFINYLKTQLDGLKVKVELRKKATPEAVEKFAPDAVVLAVGSEPFTPEIPGIGRENVMYSGQVLCGDKKTGEKVVIIGGGSNGCETGDFLAEKGKKVVVVFRRTAPMSQEVIEGSTVKMLLQRLEEKSVRILAGVKEYKEITSEGVKLIDGEGKPVFLEADSIVLATGSRPNKGLAQSLRGKSFELHEVGDCVEVRRMTEAVHEGAEAGLEI